MPEITDLQHLIAGGQQAALLTGGDPVEKITSLLAGPKQKELEQLNIDASSFGQRQATQDNAAARAQQMQLAGLLQNQATGVGPSVAEMQLNQGARRALAMQQAAAAGARGAAGPLAARNAAMGRAAASAQIAQQAGIQRLQEQQAAQRQLGGLLAGVRQADLSGQQIGAEQAMQQAQIQRDINATNQQIDTANRGRGAAALGKGLQIGSMAAMMFSDARLKEDIQEARPAYDGVRAVKYKYKPGLGEDTKPRYGILAQDLERSPKFRRAVAETPVGKAVDMPRAVSLALAEGADMHKRLTKLEGLLSGSRT